MTDDAHAVDEGALRALVPRVLAGLVRRGEDFDAAEDALQEALIEALRVWPAHPPDDPQAWLASVARRRLIDARRSEASRRAREEVVGGAEPAAAPPSASDEAGDDTLFLLFCCCHPDLAPASQVALTLRAVGGLTTREIADAFYVPEATMAQRISRAKRTIAGRRFGRPGDLAVVLRVLYIIYTTGHSGGRVDLAAEAIRLARQLTLATEEPEARGLLALMLLNHARRGARLDGEGRIVTLDRQDRGLWDTREIAEGVRVLQSALALERPGRYQIEAAIAALHDDAARAEETDWQQILAWYDDLVGADRRPGPAGPGGGAGAGGRGRAGARSGGRAARDRAAARGARRAPPLARGARAPARARRGLRGRRDRVRRGRAAGDQRRRARPPRATGGARAVTGSRWTCNGSASWPWSGAVAVAGCVAR